MRGANDGYILVAVLSVMLILTGLIASASVFARSVLVGARSSSDGAVLLGLLHGGLEIGAYQLFMLKAPVGAVSGRPLKFGDGAVTTVVLDEGAKIDVNAADPALLSGALRVAGVEPGRIEGLVARVVGFRGTKTAASPTAASPLGPATPVPATAPDAATKPSQERALHTGFRSVADFLDFIQVDRREASALEPLLTTFNFDGRVDVMTASRRVLMTLPDMSDADVDVLVAQRERARPDGLDGLNSLLGRQQPFIKFTGGPAYTMQLSAVSAAGRRLSSTAVVAASKSLGEPYYLLQWTN